MRNICYSVAMSLDGYVAGPKGESDWIVMDPEIDFSALMERFDTVLLGRKTFETSKSMYEGGAMPGVKTIVVSTTLQQAANPEVTILGKNLAADLEHVEPSR